MVWVEMNGQWPGPRLSLTLATSRRIMKTWIYLLLCVALLGTACSEQQMDAAMDDGVEGSISAKGGAADQKEENNLDIERVEKPRWKPLINFSGKRNQKTKAFKVTGREWKVEWDVKGGTEEEFIIMLKNRHDPEDFEIIANQIGAGQDFVDFEGGQGEYYLDISSKAAYTIKIQEFK